MKMLLIGIKRDCCLFLSLLVLLSSCQCNKEEERLQLALQVAGTNRNELERVLEYYKKDSLKLEASRFLISNMLGKGTISYQFYDSGHECLLDIFDFKDNIALGKTLKSGYFVQLPYKADVQYISASYLIKNIDLAFQVREKYSWCKELSFKDFCRIILPYRVQTEPLEDWRSFYYNKYVSFVDSLVAIKCGLKDIIFILNERLRKRYIHEASNIVGCISVKLIEHIGGGTCEHLAVNAVQIMRSLGIPLQLDKIPYHGKVNGGHVYNSFLDENGDFYYFSPYEREPERKQWTAPLVLRVGYELKTEKDKVLKQDINILFTDPTLRNVTSLYYATTQVIIPLPMIKDSIYLATFNRGSFKIVAEAKQDQSVAIFTDIPYDLLYFPVVYNNGRLIPISDPFIISNEGIINVIHCENKTVEVNRIPICDAKKQLKLDDTLYYLYYWNKGWQLYGETVSEDSSYLDFGTVCHNSLFLIYGNNYMGKMQRPFIIKDGEAVFF